MWDKVLGVLIGATCHLVHQLPRQLLDSAVLTSEFGLARASVFDDIPHVCVVNDCLLSRATANFWINYIRLLYF